MILIEPVLVQFLPLHCTHILAHPEINSGKYSNKWKKKCDMAKARDTLNLKKHFLSNQMGITTEDDRTHSRAGNSYQTSGRC